MPNRVYIETVGCQMNVLDSELIAADLLRAGYELVDTPRRADVLLFNTCSVRQHAEDKIYSALGRLKELKDRHPNTVIGILGCMAQKDQGLILKRAPHVDLVVGPGQLARLPELLARIAEGQTPRIEVSLDRKAASRLEVLQSFEGLDANRSPRVRPSRQQAMVRIMFGCDKFCTYCIVPRVRGPEQSRPIGQIESEVRQLADQGCLEVTLLGQTVNSYKYADGARTYRLSDLLARLQEVPGLARIRFVSNYPRHMTDDLLQAVRDLPKVCPYLHVPAQSGSDRMLQRMKRGYAAAEYRDMMARIRQTVPEATVTSDFIVGFCGETDEDFQATVDLVRESRFKNSYIFKYSARPGTAAAEQFDDDVPEAVKRRRNNELLEVQNQISLEDHQAMLGQRVEVLVEGPSKVSRKRAERGGAVQLVGRTRCDRIVVFDGPRDLAGRLIEVDLREAETLTLLGELTAEAGVSRVGDSC